MGSVTYGWIKAALHDFVAKEEMELLQAGSDPLNQHPVFRLMSTLSVIL